MATDLENFNFRLAGMGLMTVSMVWGYIIGYVISERPFDSFILSIICLLLAIFFLSICDETNGENIAKKLEPVDPRWK